MARRTGKYGTPAQRNLAVLNYLVRAGSWVNANQITRGSGGFNPADVTDILVVLIGRKYAESRPAENPQAKNEYRATETGRQNLETARSFLRMPGIADLLGLPEYEEEKDDEEK